MSNDVQDPVDATPDLPGDPSHWWRSGRKELWAGVFKGGGAKGVAYGGALEAVDAERCWFGAVAGSSAGAITSVLIAAGLTPQEIQDRTPYALRLVKRYWLRRVLDVGAPIYRNDKLRQWIDDLLRARVRALKPNVAVVDTEPVAFGQLYQASGIELHVVTMDISNGLPMVFNMARTPSASVADAVVASSAIPLAFAPGRARVQGSGGSQIHMLADGGMWANYPAFVFRDESFRHYYGLPARPKGERVVGFSLEEPTQGAPSLAAEGEVLRSFDGGKVARSKNLWVDRAQKVFSLGLIRAFVFGFLPVVGYLAVSARIRHAAQALADDGQGVGTLIQALAWFALPIIAVFAFAFVGLSWIHAKDAVAFGPQTATSLLAVSTGVAPWVGAAQNDHCVRVPVVPKIKTTKFRFDKNKIPLVVSNARTASQDQIQDILGGLDNRFAPAPADTTTPPGVRRLSHRMVAYTLVGLGITQIIWAEGNRRARRVLGFNYSAQGSNIIQLIGILVLAGGIAIVVRYLLDQEHRVSIERAHRAGAFASLDGEKQRQIRAKGLRRPARLVFWSLISAAIIVKTLMPLPNFPNSDTTFYPAGKTAEFQMTVTKYLGVGEGHNNEYAIEVARIDTGEIVNETTYPTRSQFSVGQVLKMYKMDDGSLGTYPEFTVDLWHYSAVEAGTVGYLGTFILLALADLAARRRVERKAPTPAQLAML